MTASLPPVSVICLCYNQADFVQEAIQSVLQQDYPNVELIIVDDCSKDQSRKKIRKYLEKLSGVRFIETEKNLGNCTAFNLGYQASSGKYLVDLAADDVLLPDRISRGVRQLEQQGTDYGVHYGRTIFTDEQGRETGQTEPAFNGDEMSGDLYLKLIRKHFISAPSMLIRRTVMDALGGYDEALSYEDFDFWIRSSRQFKYQYDDQPLVKKRVHGGNFSRKQRKIFNRHIQTTYKVCRKVKKLNRSAEENIALKQRLRYEIRRTLQLGSPAMAMKFFNLLKSVP